MRTAAEELEDYLFLLSACDGDVSSFDGLFLMTDLSTDEECMKIGSHPEDVSGRWLSKWTCSKGSELRDGLMMHRAESIAMSQLPKHLEKGHWSHFSKIDIGFINRKGQSSIYDYYAGHLGEHSRLIGAGSWRKAYSPFDPYEKRYYAAVARLAIDFHVFEASWWTASVRLDARCPSIALITDPTGIKEMWKLRDVPSGKKRRDALLHWVDSHWRKNRSDPDVEHYVRKHLRGQREFTQGELKVCVKESEVDMAKAGAFITERFQMRRSNLSTRRRELARRMR